MERRSADERCNMAVSAWSPRSPWQNHMSLCRSMFHCVAAARHWLYCRAIAVVIVIVIDQTSVVQWRIQMEQGCTLL